MALAAGGAPSRVPAGAVLLILALGYRNGNSEAFSPLTTAAMTRVPFPYRS